MPRDPACRSCAQKKVGCKPLPGGGACQRCVDRNLRCEWPNPSNPVSLGSASQKTSCDRCRLKRIKCERQIAASTSCVACAGKGETCSFSMPASSSAGVSRSPSCASCNAAAPGGGTPPATAQDTQGGAEGAQSSPATTPSASGSRAGWWDVVFTPSPQ